MFEAIIQKKKELQEEIQKLDKEHLAAEFKKFFEQFPEIEALRWNQYTPYFNDGDPCYFRTSDIYVRHVPGHVDRMSDKDLRDWERGWDGDVPSPQEREALKIFRTDAATDVFKAVFGDGFLVTVTRDGITVEEYDHD